MNEGQTQVYADGEFDISSTISLLGFVFFATITGYNFVKYAAVFIKNYHD